MTPWAWVAIWATGAVIALLFVRGAHVDDDPYANEPFGDV
jgi:hypothetical protein